MLEKSNFKNQIQKLIKSVENQTYLLAVSGGADSMVLATLFLECGLDFQVAHINYHLRNEDSNLDQKVVEDFCQKHQIPIHVYHVSEKDNKPENSIQLWAREIRYQFFNEVQEKENLDFLVTAHHLNDQLETFIINLSKASGISGLTGIPSHKNSILRPLLEFSKKDIYDFAKENQIEFREDLSNKKNDYLRNKIRNQIVPMLMETNDHFLENFNQSLFYLNQTKTFVDQKMGEIEKQLTISNDQYLILNKEKLEQESDFVQFEILKKYGFDKAEEIKKIFTAQTGSTFFGKEYQILVNRNELIFTKSIIDENLEEEIVLCQENNPNKNLIEIRVSDYITVSNDVDQNIEWFFDADTVAFPIKVRRKMEGDFFYPIGFGGKKKVSKYYKDEKMSILAKQKTWILVDGNNDVLGIFPLRQDKRYARNEKTSRILKIF
ncbi:tRNA lysidine(34) synthetase TilS [Chryseobacterium sp.]|uniref:tRNA lysidine(34) synthetase TilS n=1 Tax=Chryseobacterium sp. TaxID=1871047 RepID=UPI00388ED639